MASSLQPTGLSPRAKHLTSTALENALADLCRAMTENGEGLTLSAQALGRKHDHNAPHLSPQPTNQHEPSSPAHQCQIELEHSSSSTTSQSQQQEPTPSLAHGRGPSSQHILIAPKSAGVGYVCLWIGCSFEGTFVSREELDLHQRTVHVGQVEGQTLAKSGVDGGVVEC